MGYPSFKRGGRSSQKESNYTRIGNLFESKFTPDKANVQLSTRCDGKYLEAVRDVINNNDSVYFTFTEWKGGEYPVLSVAPAKEGGKARGGYSRNTRGAGSRDNRGSFSDRNRSSRDVKHRGIEDEPQDDAPIDDEETSEESNWDK